MVKLRLRKLVDTEEAMEKFITDYRIPPNVSLMHCKMGEWYYLRRTGEVVIPVLAFVEGGMRIPMGPVTKGPQALPISPHLVHRQYVQDSGLCGDRKSVV